MHPLIWLIVTIIDIYVYVLIAAVVIWAKNESVTSVPCSMTW